MNASSSSRPGIPKLLLLMFIAWLLPALACNFPAARGQPAEVNVQALRATMSAQIQSEPTAAIASLPGEVSSPPHGPEPTTAYPFTVSTPGQIPTPAPNSTAPFNYLTQPGDTLEALSRRFQVEPQQIFSPTPLPEKSYLPPGIYLWIQSIPEVNVRVEAIFPDIEVTYSPTSLDFDVEKYVSTAGGYLSSHTENVNGEIISGADIINRVAQEFSVNPRLLLALLEQRSGWVFGKDKSPDDLDYPIGFRVAGRQGLYQELVMTATHLNIGYYGWRSGELQTIKYSDGSTRGINPWLNPGSVGVQNLFAKFYPPNTWSEILYGPGSFSQLYEEMFGNPWERAARVEPFLTPDLAQPILELPFSAGERWSLTGGPHASWNTGSPRGAIDFAAVTGEPACSISRAWVTASATGVISRSANNVVAIDLDGDGNEQTGWVIVYLHLADEGRIQAGQHVDVNDRLGHPSCERGQSTGTHVHMARKFNGEWLPADYPIPMILSGWQVQAEDKNYQGSLVKADHIVSASPLGLRTSIIVR